MNVLAVIPARKGSTRIERKNIRDLGGYPLITWTIRDSKLSKNINKIVVTTDDESVKKISMNEDVQVIDRPKELADDYIHVDGAVIHTLEYLKYNESYTPDLVVLLQPTTPFRTIHHLDKGIEVSKYYDSFIFMTELDKFIWTRDMKSINYDYINRPRSQDKEWELVETGNYITKPKIYNKTSNRLGGKIGYILVPSIWNIDIDVEKDFVQAESYIKKYDIGINDT